MASVGAQVLVFQNVAERWEHTMQRRCWRTAAASGHLLAVRDHVEHVERMENCSSHVAWALFCVRFRCARLGRERLRVLSRVGDPRSKPEDNMDALARVLQQVQDIDFVTGDMVNCSHQHFRSVLWRCGLEWLHGEKGDSVFWCASSHVVSEMRVLTPHAWREAHERDEGAFFTRVGFQGAKSAAHHPLSLSLRSLAVSCNHRGRHPEKQKARDARAIRRGYKRQ